MKCIDIIYSNSHHYKKIIFQAVQIYSTLGMTNIDDLVNNIFSVFDRFYVRNTKRKKMMIVVSG